MDLDGWRGPRLTHTGGGGPGRGAPRGGDDDETPEDDERNPRDEWDEGWDTDEEPLMIHLDGPQAPWEHRGPNGSIVRYEQGWWYTLTRGSQKWRALVACSRREVFHTVRGHITVFKASRAQPKHRALPRLYIWATFVEADVEADVVADVGSYCALIPDPANPKFKLAAGDPVPKRFRKQQLSRTDQLFKGLRHAPTLRLVVRADDYLSMIAHAFWAAELRGRL